MRVETIYRPIPYADLKPGTFFKVLRDGEQFFALAALNSRKELCSLIFTKSSGQTDAPWYSGGEISGTVVAIPDAVIRPDAGSMSAYNGNIPIGSLICDNAGSYIRASAGTGNTFTANIDTGFRVDLTDGQCTPVIYSRWSAGTEVDGVYRPIFSFPLPT